MDHGELGINPLGHTTRESQTGLITKVFLDSSIAIVYLLYRKLKEECGSLLPLFFFLALLFFALAPLAQPKSSFHKSFL